MIEPTPRAVIAGYQLTNKIDIATTTIISATTKCTTRLKVKRVVVSSIRPIA